MNTTPVQLIAVVGGSGAGKGWLVDRLCRILGDKAGRLHLDDFYRDRSHLPMTRRAQVNFDQPTAIDWAQAERVLRDCRAGQPVRVPHYDFATHCRSGHVTLCLPRPIVFVDGLWLLRPPEIRALFDFTIYLDAPTVLRHSRRLARDVIERGYSAEAIERQLRTAVAPMHERYVEPQKRWADVVLAQPYRESQVAHLADRLWTIFAESALLPPWMHETFRAELFDALLAHEYCH